jgi:hypothetical protein
MNETYTINRRRRWLIAGFAPIVVFALFADSRIMLDAGFDGQILSNLTAPLYLLLMLAGLRPGQRLMAIIFVPFSALGEYIFSLIFQLYTYKFGTVPFYVPFGHAILFSTGLMLADLPLVLSNQTRVRWGLIAFHAGLFAGAIIALHDSLSAIFGALFIPILYRKRGRPFYLIMGVLVLYIELVGTAFGCWIWTPIPFGVLQTTNPPVGAFVCYVIADILVMKLAVRLALFLKWSDRRPHTPTPKRKVASVASASFQSSSPRCSKICTCALTWHFRRFSARYGAEDVGFPRFKGKQHYDSLTYPQYGNGVQLAGDRLIVSKLGAVNDRVDWGGSHLKPSALALEAVTYGPHPHIAIA